MALAEIIGHVNTDMTVNVADVAALLAVLATLLTLVNSNWQDRKLAKREFADQIRNAAALLTVKLERWRELAATFFEELQPEITSADIELVKAGDAIKTRDSFWRALGNVWLTISKRISDEEIELSYANLYGYDPKVRELFLTAISRLKSLRVAVHHETLMKTQKAIMDMGGQAAHSAELGNKLRNIAGLMNRLFSQESNLVIVPFQKEMITLIGASDGQITSKSVSLSAPDSIFPSERELLERLRTACEGEAPLPCHPVLLPTTLS